MIIGAAILTKSGNLFCPDFIPYGLKKDTLEHVSNFLYALSLEGDDIELPYIETTNLRYIYKLTDDLYWLLVTKVESDMFTDINLLGRFVCTIMEYGMSETNSTTLTDEQCQLFYRHILRPWDENDRCSFCCQPCIGPELWQRDFEARLQFINGVRDGQIEDNDVNYFNGLISEAWLISEKLSPRWNASKNHQLRQGDSQSDTDSLCSSDHSISEETVIECCRLKCRLEDIRIELTRLQDPYLRLFARRDMLVDSDAQNGTAPTLKDLILNDESRNESF